MPHRRVVIYHKNSNQALAFLPFFTSYLWLFNHRSSNPVWQYRKLLSIQRLLQWFASSPACLILVIACYRTLKIWTDR